MHFISLRGALRNSHQLTYGVRPIASKVKGKRTESQNDNRFKLKMTTNQQTNSSTVTHSRDSTTKQIKFDTVHSMDFVDYKSTPSHSLFLFLSHSLRYKLRSKFIQILKSHFTNQIDPISLITPLCILRHFLFNDKVFRRKLLFNVRNRCESGFEPFLSTILYPQSAE